MITAPALRHIVMMQFKDTTSATELAEIVRRFADLPRLVPGIETFEYGENSSPEALNDGLSHCFTITFASNAARDAYLPHPDHQAFATWVQAWLKKVVVLDYWARSG